MKKILLSVAGYDPCGGAGVALDLKVFEQLGFQGMAVLTSVTAQNTKRVTRVRCLPAKFLWDQYRTLCQDVRFSGVKVGMIGCRENIKVIGRILAETKDIPRVVDPVFRSSSGAWLLEKKAIPFYLEKISGKVSLLTPNLEEAGLLSKVKIENLEDMKEAAKKIYRASEIPCLIKGGHLEKRAMDLLYDGQEFYLFEKTKINKKVHGTGCFLSSAILAFLAKGNPLKRACLLGTQLTHQAIKRAIQIGQGQHIISFL